MFNLQAFFKANRNRRQLTRRTAKLSLENSMTMELIARALTLAIEIVKLIQMLVRD